MDIIGANIFKNLIGTFSGPAAFKGLSCKICEYNSFSEIGSYIKELGKLGKVKCLVAAGIFASILGPTFVKYSFSKSGIMLLSVILPFCSSVIKGMLLLSNLL